MAATRTPRRTRRRMRRQAANMPRRDLRVLTASARRLDLDSKTEGRQLRALRQGWQADAWNYRDSVTELRYAIQFKANALSRMRLYVGVETGEEDEPVLPLDKATGIPEAIQALAQEALRDLARNKGELRQMLKDLSTNIDVAGECFTLGQTDPATREEDWSIRSVDEIVLKDDGYELREIPDGPHGVIPWVKLEPELTEISRIWTPHPRFKLLADSPLRSMLQTAESILLLRRMDRAELRSRLNRGILAVPDEMTIKAPIDDDEDPEVDPFMAALAKALIEPIGDEGTASAYAPVVIRGAADALKALQHITLTNPFEEQAIRKDEQLVGTLGTGFDLPKEVLTGVADLNHWSAWQVDDNTFRHHLEPHTITCCDALTAGYFRPRLLALDVPPEFAGRLVIWYDPTELVTHPDQTKDALELYDRHAISAEALARVAGFTHMDAPTPEETVIRMLQNMRTPPANLVMAAVHQMFPQLTIPPITTSGTVPGVKPTGVDPGEEAEPEAAIPGQASPAAPVELETPPAPEPAQPGEPGPPPSAVTASGQPETHRLSRRLAAIDRDLRTRLQIAASAQMLRQLERAGAKVRASKAAKDVAVRASIAGVPNELVPMSVPRDVLLAASLPRLDDWSGLSVQFMNWTESAQKRALAIAVQLGVLAADSETVASAGASMLVGRNKAWEWTEKALTNLGDRLLNGATEGLNPDTLVPTGLIRGALGIAGGGDYAPDPSGNIMAIGEPIGQIGTGTTIRDLLEQAGMETASYEWEHSSMTINPFEPHLNLDGTQFASFDDDALANSEGWPENGYFLPGDHEGCGCDAVALWAQGEGSGEQPEGEQEEP